ncbi:MAG: PKD domain-containing protein [Draconibacterium sp.]|nr:PKD domain-containing protein [Draconibacterium sp.]
MRAQAVSLIAAFFFVGCNHPLENPNIQNDYPVWIEMMEQPTIEMGKAHEAFDSYWETHEHFKGDRSKQFEQWYAINSKRLDQFGNVISAAQVSSEFQKLRLKSAGDQQGKWFNYGPVSVGPRNGKKRDGGRVKDIEFHPTDKNTFYVSTFKGGLFKTSDYGTTWAPLTDGLTEQVLVCEVGNANPDIIFIGTDLGVYKSTDGGVNWNNTVVTDKTNALLIKTNEQNTIIAGCENGIRRSTDGGTTWTLVQSASKVTDLDSHPTNPEILYAGTNGTPGEFYRSADGGLTWTKNSTFGQGCFMGVAVSPAQPNYVYVINLRDHLGEDSFEGFYLSEDAGLNFTKQSGHTPCISGYNSDGTISRGQPNYNLFVCADPIDANIVYAGGVKSWKSTDKGKTWTHFYEGITSEGDNLHLDQLNWAFSPHDYQIFAVNDGGVYYLNDENKFQMITDGLPIAEVYECTQSQTVKSNVAGGTMHCGIKLNYNGEWVTPWGGDEATCIIDPTDENYVYHIKYGKISRSTNGGFNFSRINASDADKGNYTGTGTLHKGDPNILFVGLLEVERTINARASSVNWSQISSFGGSKKIQKIEQCTANHDVLYVARGSAFYRSDNTNAPSPVFINLTSNLPGSGSVNDIATTLSNSNVVYILLGSQIYKSSDKGNSWINISDNLPEVALLEMIYDNSSNEGIYVGTDIGVFYKDSTMTDWLDYSLNLPAIRVSGMDIYYGENRDESFITISTDGRGFWRSQLYGSTVEKPIADFTVDRTPVYVTEKINFTNKSSENPVGSFNWKIEGGVPAVSYELNPSVTFREPGTYKVTLEVANSSGVATKSINIVVNALSIPVAQISANKTLVFRGGIISFSDASEKLPASWEWTFEGGEPSISNEQNPVVTYNTLGNYNVTLKVTNAEGVDTNTWTDYVSVVENTGDGDLQVHYEFNNNLDDESSYQRDLTIIGNYTPTYVMDKNANISNAYKAPNSNTKYLANGYKGITGNGTRTVTAWFKTSPGNPTRKTIISWGRNLEGQMFNVMLQNDGTVRIEAGSCSVRSIKGELNDNNWHHVAVTYNPADGDKLQDVKIYIDGILDTNQSDTEASYRSEQVSINTDNTENNVRIGSVQYANYYWVGDLDDVRIYSKCLTAEDILGIYSLETGIIDFQKIKKVKFYSGKTNVKIDILDENYASVKIYDLNGRLIRNYKLNRGLNTISLKSGIYIARVHLRNEIKTEKIICF